MEQGEATPHSDGKPRDAGARKRLRDPADAEPRAQGATEKEGAGQEVPSLPRSEGGAAERKRIRYRARPFGVHSVPVALEHLRTKLASTYGETRNREDVMKRVDDILYLCDDVSQGCEPLKAIVDKMDVGWQMIDTPAGRRVFTMENMDVINALPHVAKWLIEIDSWDLLIKHMLWACSVKEDELEHPEMPSMKPSEWIKVVIGVMKKLHYLAKEYERLKEPPATYETNWRET